MKIEQEIQQKDFRNIFQKTALNLVYTTNWLLGRQQSFFNSFGITDKQYNVLRILKGQYPKTISTCDIRSRMLDKNSDASRIVDRLSNRQLVTKQICPSDKRLVDVTISNKGIKLLQLIETKIEELDGIVNSISDEEALQLNNILDKIRG